MFKANLCESESFTDARAAKACLRVALQFHVAVVGERVQHDATWDCSRLKHKSDLEALCIER